MIQNIVISVMALLVTLGILVSVHEFGHYWVARRCGVKVLRFSIGFGKAIKTWTGRDGCEYVIAPIPLGGYVKMLGQDDTHVGSGSDVPASEQHMSFATKALWQRTAIVAAGPIANFLLAIVVFWLINVIYGVRDAAPIVDSVVEDSPAFVAGLKAGDEIIAVDGVETTFWSQVNLALVARLGETGELRLRVITAESNIERDVSIILDSWLSGVPEMSPLRSLGINLYIPERPAKIARITAGGRAELAGLLPGDEVISVDGQPMSGWMQWVQIIRSSPELDLNVVVQRAGALESLVLTPAVVDGAEFGVSGEMGFIGASVQEVSSYDLLPPEMRREINYNIFTALPPALNETWSKSVLVLGQIRKIIVGMISVKNLSGPITIAQVAGETATYGLDVYLGFLALLSISLGVLNLLPIPVLDGGHLLYYSIEAIIRRPVPERVQAFGLQLGLMLICSIMILAVYNDVVRLL